jgi:hypothetical protein
MSDSRGNDRGRMYDNKHQEYQTQYATVSYIIMRSQAEED